MRAQVVGNWRVARDPSSTNVWFAALAAVGAFWLVEGVLVGIALVLLWLRVFHREYGPPRFEPTLLPAAFVGAFVAVRLGGWRGLLGLLAFASVPLIHALTYPISAALDCSHGNTDVCRFATDLDFVLPQAWLLPGLALGGLAALTTRTGLSVRVELEALAPIALLAQLVNYVLPLRRGYPGPSSFDIAVTLLGSFASAYILARRSPAPLRSALIIAGALLLLTIPWITYFLWFNTDSEMDLWQRWPSFAGPVVLVMATYVLSMTTRDRARKMLA
ncbi:MAG: hypothetical protein M3R54_05220 [Chloroflexota bacterium]|nr:hypothetical protein [Chloroflexota bacterium]